MRKEHKAKGLIPKTVAPPGSKVRGLLAGRIIVN
jgi:hypothetical protein